MIRRPELYLAALVACWFGWPLLHPGHIGYDGDSLLLFYPAMRIAREQILAGCVPLWNPYKFMGAPLLANLMVPVFYPPQLIALLFPQPFGLHLMLVLHAAFAAIGAFRLAGAGFKVGASGALLAGFSFACSAPMTVHLTHPNQFYAMAWLPWVWLAALSMRREPLRGFRQMPALALALGMQMLAGQPQIVFYSSMLIAVGWIFFPSDVPRRPRALAIIASCVLAVALAAVHLVPAWELSRESMRRTMQPDFSTSYSLTPGNLFTLLFPNALGSPGTGGYRGPWNYPETAIFFGQPALFLALISPFANFRKLPVACLAAAAAVGIILALGGNTPFGLLLRDAPLLSDFRAPARAFILTVLAGSILAGMSLDFLAARVTRESSQRAIVLLGIGVQILALAWFRYHLSGIQFHTRALVDLPGIETLFEDSADLPGGRLLNLAAEVPNDDASINATRRRLFALQPDAHALRGRRAVFGYDEGMLPTIRFVAQLNYYWRNIFTPSPDPLLLGVMGVEFLVTDKPVYSAWERIGQAENIQVWRNPQYRGEVFTRNHWPEVDFSVLAARINGRVSTAALQIADATPGTTAAPPAPLQYQRLPGGRVHVKLPAEFQGELLLSESYLPGWFARADSGARIPGKRITHYLIAFEIPAGAREVRLAYSPHTFRVGGAISLAALAALAVLALAARPRKFKIDPI